MLVVDKDIWKDGDIHYNFSVQDSRYDHRNRSIWSRMQSACKIMFGKPIYYNDVYIGDPKKFNGFVKDLMELMEEVKGDE